MDKMVKHIETLLDGIGPRDFSEGSDEKIFGFENLIPAQITGELLHTIKFNRAIIESIRIGIIVVDRDAKIITFNAAALEIVNLPYDNVLNHQMASVFPKQGREKLIGAFKRVLLNADLKKMSFNLSINAQKIRITVSLFKIDNKVTGWVIAMEATGQWLEKE